ncbi:Fc receptor-like protein 5 isoform X2 [Salarias fasciatus]|uniref:Fc receptor-like protein 5 isoform X2 n=1 Tax=Salarias fasciatus TaxID=181472 RepID=UPI001176A871|nr:Fc receptor-like protein 5 isoform X2 [Salarias fasciatus]
MKNRQTRNLLPILALASLFIKISGSNSVHPVLTGPDKAYLGSRAVYRCTAPGSSPPVRYELVSSDGALMASSVDPQGDQPATLGMKVSEASAGAYHCRATAGGNTGVSNSITLSVVIPPLQTTVTSEPFPPVLYEGSRLVLSCGVDRGSHLSYTWFFNRTEVDGDIEDVFNVTGNKLVVEEVTPEHAGSYYCIASTSVQDIQRFSSSSDIQVTVKVYVSKPEISFSVFREGKSYRANVTCWSSRGSPPANFSLLLDEAEVYSVRATQSLVGWFVVEVVPGLDMGLAHCQVKTELQELKSEPVTLEVVPVGGDVSVNVEYLYTSASRLAAALLTCKVSRGTFPLVSWLLDDSVLPSLPHSALINEGQTLILTQLGPEESGSYRCRARDSYDSSGPWVESEAQLVQVTEARMTTTEKISISFCCFLLLVLVVCSVCVLKMFNHDRAHPQTAPVNHVFLSQLRRSVTV